VCVCVKEFEGQTTTVVVGVSQVRVRCEVVVLLDVLGRNFCDETMVDVYASLVSGRRMGHESMDWYPPRKSNISGREGLPL
jgi:hypothetical protein